MTILGDSFGTMNRPDDDGPKAFLGKYIRYGREILTQPSFESSICALTILNSDIFIGKI